MVFLSKCHSINAFKAKTPLRIAVSIFNRLKVGAFIYLPTTYLYLNIFCSDVQIKVMKFKIPRLLTTFILHYYKNSSRRPTNRFVKECSRSWPDFLSPVKLYFASYHWKLMWYFLGSEGDRSRLLNSPPNWRSSINLTTS